MKIPEILNTINLDEEQIKALDTFFKDWTEDIKASTKKEMISESKIPKGYIKKKDAEKAFKLYGEDAEKAFKLYEKDTEKAFDLAKTDWQEEFNTILEDKQDQYTESMAKAMQDIYEEIESKVKKDFEVSEEYKAFQKVKDAIIPVTINESQKQMLEKIQDMERKEVILEENERELSKNVAINALLKDFPQEYTETVRKFISKAENEEEVYERFNTIVEMVDKGGIKQAVETAATFEEVATEPKAKPTFARKTKQPKHAAAPKKRTVAPVFESATGSEKKPAEVKKNKLGLSKWEDTVINLAFPQQTI